MIRSPSPKVEFLKEVTRGLLEKLVKKPPYERESGATESFEIPPRVRFEEGALYSVKLNEKKIGDLFYTGDTERPRSKQEFSFIPSDYAGNLLQYFLKEYTRPDSRIVITSHGYDDSLDSKIAPEPIQKLKNPKPRKKPRKKQAPQGRPVKETGEDRLEHIMKVLREKGQLR